MENTLQIIKRIKVDALYGKKKHFNAADRKQEYHYLIGIPLLVLNVISGSILFYVLTDDVDNWVKYIPLVITLITALLSGFQTFLNLEKKVEGHKRVGNKYLHIMKSCNLLEGNIKDDLISRDEIRIKLEGLSNKIDEINIEAEAFHTNKRDYNKAKKGIENGEEFYTDNEINI